MDTTSTPLEQDARRSRLREFQSDLMQRMRAVSSGGQAHANRLGVVAGQDHWLIDLREASEIVPVGAITPVPFTRDWFLGLANVRGNLISVVDLARFNGQPPTPIDKQSRIVVFAPSLAFNGGVLVSGVLGLRAIREMREREADAAQATPWSPRSHVDAGEQVWAELDLSLLIRDQRFLHVGA